MKRTARAIFLSALLVLVLSVSAMALDAPTAPGIYWLFDGDITVAGTAQEVEIEGRTYSDFYPNAEKLTVSYAATSGAVSGCEYLILVTNETLDNGNLPTAENIVYIDQATATADGVSFTVYPSALTAGDYFVYLTSNAETGCGSEGITYYCGFSYYQMPYKLGDVNEDGTVTTGDAVDILQTVVGKKTLSTTQVSAADVDGNGSVTTGDAVYILQFVVGKSVPYALTNN